MNKDTRETLESITTAESNEETRFRVASVEPYSRRNEIKPDSFPFLLHRASRFGSK